MSEFMCKRICDLSEKMWLRIDEFILDKKTNGEFINTIRFLQYHPQDRFKDDSIAVIDKKSGSISGVMMAASTQADNSKIISHPGTTFAGPVVSIRTSIKNKLEVMRIICEYYERKYTHIEIKNTPSIYGTQDLGCIDYFLLRSGYISEVSALSNVLNISDVNSEEDILFLYDSAKRNHTKKVMKSDLFLFEAGKDISSLVWEQMNENLNEKFSIQTTHTYDEICQLKMKFPQNIVPYYVFTEDRDYGAFALVFKFKNVFHTQYLDTNYKYTGKYPNLLLIYNLIKIARREGFQWFSFGASTDGGELNEGLYNYKAGYGGGDIVMPMFRKQITVSQEVSKGE